MLQLHCLRDHVRQECLFRRGLIPHSPIRKVITPTAQVSDVMTASPSKLKGDISKKLTAHFVAAQEGGILEVATAGKPQTWMKVTKGQTPSSQATDRTLRRRFLEIQPVREVVSSSSPSSQHTDELKLMHKAGAGAIVEERRTSSKCSKAWLSSCDEVRPAFALV